MSHDRGERASDKTIGNGVDCGPRCAQRTTAKPCRRLAVRIGHAVVTQVILTGLFGVESDEHVPEGHPEAFRKVKDAPVFQTTTRDIRLRQEERMHTLRQALTLAELRYDHGVSSPLEILDAQRQLDPAEADLNPALRDQPVSVVQINRAPGGGRRNLSPDGKDGRS